MEEVPKLGAVLVCTALVMLAGFAGGWVVNGWRMSAAVAEVRQARAEDRADAAESALTDLAEGASRVKAAADAYKFESSAITGQLAQISKELKSYAKDKPLPVDCRPDAGRVRSLAEAVAAAKQAAAR
ncbi:hypothetical protein [Pandoraea sp. ISTKB]|uniref:hypothetical protein n=1 Tax=Pandoraea sp. ISTKB TaxID=1586708 RepID=UPI0008466C22|nr:hypothetical protein [Pandoraea sp. ISTKB]ODP33058.1 hypothetical protein A9762_20660 [Pandoraea sp. ISTKB]